MFLFGPLGGVFADRMDKRRVLYLTQTLAGLLAGAFAVLVATGSIRLWVIYLLALALGFVNVIDNPARQAFISEMATAEDLPNAVTLNSVAMNMARVFGGGAAAYGVMASVMGVGAVVGGLISAARPRPRARALCLAAIGWGIAILAAAAAPSLPLELAALVFVGYGSITFNSLAKTTLQLAAAPTMRGRVMALWALAWLGSTPIGGPIVGFVGQDVGARWSLVVGGLPTLLCGIPALPALARIDRRGPDSPDRNALKSVTTGELLMPGRP
jgi:MFS family permease